ncbi:hypothetical protein [uncultured Tenacibaculum sp.]|uniref:hypothetical protein n=1 Tax=uncultured Tenacibaculum sp. TaxID=174713 RepID=UPI002635EC03|nr:hypothetical protein [uncultured Tenacibaculum sp.]
MSQVKKTDQKGKLDQKEKGSFLGLAAAVIIGVVGIQRYNTFKNFVDSVLFEVKILKFDANDLTIFMSPVSSLNVPYSIRKIEFVFDNKLWQAKNCHLHKMIVANSQIPIPFQFVKPITTEDPNVMIITYNFWGFTIKRAYQPRIETLQRNFSPRVQAANLNDRQVKISKCGCDKKSNAWPEQ